MKPIATEKAVLAIEKENVLTFELPMKKTKEEIKKEVEELFDVKVKKVRTIIQSNKKYAMVKLKKEFPAIDIATKLGMM